MNKFCSACGAALPAAARFCPSCGASIAGETGGMQPAGINGRQWSIVAGVAVLCFITAGIYYYFGFVKPIEKKQTTVASQELDHVHEHSPATQAASSVSAEDIERARAEVAGDAQNAAKVTHLANLLFDSGRYQEAIPYYKKSLELEPNNADVMVDLGVCYYNLEQFPTARSQFKLALKGSPEHINALYNLGIVSLQMRDLEELKTAWGKLMQVAPASQQARQAMQYLESIHQEVQDYTDGAGTG